MREQSPRYPMSAWDEEKWTSVETTYVAPMALEASFRVPEPAVGASLRILQRPDAFTRTLRRNFTPNSTIHQQLKRLRKRGGNGTHFALD
jgi:hypothetical protein